MKLFRRGVDGKHIDVEKILGDPNRQVRLEGIRLMTDWKSVPGTKPPVFGMQTRYSCPTAPPPALAVWKAQEDRYLGIGLLDYNTVEGAREFVAAAAVFNLPVTVGFSCQVTLDDFVLDAALMGIPHNHLTEAAEFCQRLNDETMPFCQEFLNLANTIGAVPVLLCHGTESGELLSSAKNFGFSSVLPSFSAEIPVSQQQNCISLCQTLGYWVLSDEEDFWILIGQERRSMEDVTDAFFSPETIRRLPSIKRRSKVYADYAKRLYGM